ncbi:MULTISPECIES: DUF551 domain-containing protein [unclassified Pseudomonas]|uniref:DUF551 domain-containing protein n=1 Tax=unclassified Pseudomonas TaxID=196821 RepID=UPI000DA1C26A|nr:MULTISPECIES: DUF551 domain-containing protein [unclassified Pseudomonas]
MSEWIKYSDKQPADELDGFAVIVAINHHSMGRISDCAVWNKRAGKKGRFEFWDSQVTHWQPLPSPPGEQP